MLKFPKEVLKHPHYSYQWPTYTFAVAPSGFGTTMRVGGDFTAWHFEVVLIPLEDS